MAIAITTAEVLVAAALPPDSTPDGQAAAAGLVYVGDDEPGITRLRCGRGFRYRTAKGRTLPRGHKDRRRINELAIPPAWTDVWICRDANGHLQATGRDDAGRKQYLYHPRWRSLRDAAKFHRLAAFAEALPAIRESVDTHLRLRSFTREKVLALALAVLDETLIRVGHDHYLRTNGSFGLTTLQQEHVDIDGSRIRFAFPGKSGQDIELELRHPRLARQLLACEEAPGQRLFSWEADDGWHEITSQDVNSHLAEITGDKLTAKDFRTWGGTIVVAEHLHELGPAETEAERKARVLAAIDVAAQRLGNTRAVARASYVDPRVTDAYQQGVLDDVWDSHDGERGRLSPAERAVQRLLDPAA